MTHISILDEKIKGLDDIKARLEERDTTVSVIKSFEDLKNLQTCTLVVSEKKVSSDHEIINIARSLKIKKVILIDNQSKAISQKNTETSLIERFLYHKYGPGQMWEEVAKDLKENSVQIFMNTLITEV